MSMSGGRETDQAADKLTDPQYAVVKQLRIPVAVVITIRIERVKFRGSNGVPQETLTRNEFGSGCLHGWIGVAEPAFLIVGCKGEVGVSSRSV